MFDTVIMIFFLLKSKYIIEKSSKKKTRLDHFEIWILILVFVPNIKAFLEFKNRNEIFHFFLKRGRKMYS